MPLWQPQTTISFCADTGVTRDQKPYFSSNSGMISWLGGKVKFADSQLSYQRADERQYTVVQHNYYDMLECDVMYWANTGFSSKYLVALITGIEWVNPETTKVYFEIDPYCSFCGEIEWQQCMVEREHVNNDWTDGQPNWNNIGIPEKIDGSPVTIINQLVFPMIPSRFIVISPFKGNPPQYSVSGMVQDGIYSGLNMTAFNTADEVDAFINEVAANPDLNLNDIVGVISVPAYFLNEEEWDVANINAPWIVLQDRYNNSKVYSSQYCMFRIEGIAGKARDFLPELMGKNGLATPQTGVRGRANIMGGLGGIAAYVYNYKGIEDDLEDAFMVTDLPQGVWLGANWLDNGIKNAITAIDTGTAAIKGAAGGAALGTAIMPGVGTVVGGVLGGLSGAASGVGALADAAKQSLKVGGDQNASANIAVGFGAYRICVRWYVSPQATMEAIDSYFDRFGYAVGKIKVPNVNTRPLWNYVKTVEAHIGGDIPANYREDIEDMLNNGVTFWNVSRRSIGDFSNAEANQPAGYIDNDYDEQVPPVEPEPDEPDPSFPEPDPNAFSVLPDEVETYSLAADGDTYLNKNFRVREFRCRDGTDKILISKRLVELLQIIRDHFGAAVTINSGYRTASHNAAVGGATKSQHLYGRAADIVVTGHTALEVYNYVNTVLPQYTGGIGCYRSGNYVHVDVRPSGYWRDNNV